MVSFEKWKKKKKKIISSQGNKEQGKNIHYY